MNNEGLNNKMLKCYRCGNEHRLEDRIPSQYSTLVGSTSFTLCPECRGKRFNVLR